MSKDLDINWLSFMSLIIATDNFYKERQAHMKHDVFGIGSARSQDGPP